jgi:hypothetical protein
MSDLADIEVQVLQDRDLVVTRRDGRASHLPQRRGITHACLDGLHANGSRPRASEISRLGMAGRSCQGSAARVAKLLTDAPARAGATLESPAEALPGLVFAFRLRPDEIAEELGVDRAIAVKPRGWLWLHFNLADAWACHFLRLSPYFPPARELLVAGNDHQQLNASEACLFGVFSDLVFGLDGATDEIGFLHFAMIENLLVTPLPAQLHRRHAQGAEERLQGAERRGADGHNPGICNRRH